MKKEGNPLVSVPELYHVCIVVRDREKSIERYQEVLGIGPWRKVDIDNSVIGDLTYYGRPVKSFRQKVGFAMVGPLQLELIEPVEGDLIYFDFLREHGEGLHHLGHVRVPNVDEAVRIFEDAGFACVQSGHFGGGGFAYMDTRESLGFLIELLEWPEGKPAPARR